MCALFAVVWYYYLLDPNSQIAESRWVLFSLGLVPTALAIIVSLVREQARFAPIAVVALAMPLALRTPFHPLSPDVAFHIGKTLWAAAGNPLIDPVMGVPSPYPAVLHIICGAVSRLSGIGAQTVLRLVTVLVLVTVWLVIWKVCGKTNGVSSAISGLFVASLTLFAKDISGILLASPATFSMPLAILAWYLLVTPTRRVGTGVGAASLALAIVIWPTHLFSVLGVALVDAPRRRRQAKLHLYGLAVLVAVLVNLAIRTLVPRCELWAGLRDQLTIPDTIGIKGLIAFISLGTDNYGGIPTAAGVALMAVFAFWACRGWLENRRNEGMLACGRLGVGLLLGALVSPFFLPLLAHMIRLQFVALIFFLPLATAGFESFTPPVLGPNWFRARRIWVAGLSLVWLVPFLAAAGATTERQHQWLKRASRVTEYLNAHSTPGDRIWATPETFRWVALGKTHLFGFLAHNWPMYFTPPRDAAREYGEAYLRILNTSSADSAHAELVQHGVDWIVIDQSSPERPKWDPAALPGIRLDTSINGYTLYSIGTQSR